MSIKYVKGDAVQALLAGEVDFLIHCCNNKGVMRSGIAKQIKTKIPEAYTAYKKMFNIDPSHRMGGTSLGGKVINIIGQDSYGYGSKRYGHYGYIAQGLASVSFEIHNYVDCYDNALADRYYNNEVKLAIPYKFASDRAGCDWNIILELIEGILAPEFDIVIYHLEDL